MKEDPKKVTTPENQDAEDEVLARRMFMKASWVGIPLILASFTVSRSAFAATCAPNLCGPGDACNPDTCGPDLCTPGSCNPVPCNPDLCGPDKCGPAKKGYGTPGRGSSRYD